MAKQEHIDVLKQGVVAWNKWREEHPDIKPDLSGAKLTRINLRWVQLDDQTQVAANLANVDFTKAWLSWAILTLADLTGANLSKADIGGADLFGVRLTNANLSESWLTDTNLSSAYLKGANFSQANLLRTLFTNVDLSEVRGLETLQHHGPSSIGLDTIYRSQGKIPERFLREAGVSDSFLEYMHSLMGQPIRYFTCFISHSHRDQSFCNRLYADLRSHNIPSWYFPEDATWGKSIWGEIDRSIKLYDKLVVVCSEHSLQSSAVLREMERALQREDSEGKHILFPLRLDNYLFEQWQHERKADVVSKVAGDFRGWDTDANEYDKAFQKFLKALKAQEAATKS